MFNILMFVKQCFNVQCFNVQCFDFQCFNVREIVSACLTNIFSLFVCNEHVVISNEHIAMTEHKKRKIESEDRVFNSEWTNKCLLSVVNSKILCLDSRNVISVLKENNLRRHCETNRPNLAELDINIKCLKPES